ncbi:unnamed protein product [Camellia sinensis]
MATNHKMPFMLDKKEIVLIKPSSPTPSHVLSLSTIDNTNHLEVLCQTMHVYQANIKYPNGNNNHESILSSHSDPVCVIKEALSRVLVHYYPLAGKLKRHSDGKLRINCNADGVPFLEATATCDLSSLHYFDGVDVETAKHFVTDFPTRPDDEGYHPLVIQVTKFSCGGFTIGMGLSHSVCDGFGAAQFFRALAELASGKGEPSVKPVWERERLLGSPNNGLIQFLVDQASCANSPYFPVTDMIHECFNVKSESLKRLKNNLMKASDDNNSFTVVEALGAYIWRSRVRALELNPDGKTVFFLALGIRKLLNPPLPDGYYGNAFVSSIVVLNGRDLDEGPLSKVASLIRESKEIASNNEYILKELNLLETIRELKIETDNKSGAAAVLTDWRRLNLMGEVDFGWKGAVNIIPLPWNIDGYVDLNLLLPPFSLDETMEGGVRVFVALPRAAMAKFKEEMSALELGDGHALI